MKCKIIHININGISKTKITNLDHRNADIIAITETHTAKIENLNNNQQYINKNITNILSYMNDTYKYIHAPYNTKSRGVLTLVKESWLEANGIKWEDCDIENDAEGRYTILTTKATKLDTHKHTTFISIYAPADSNTKTKCIFIDALNCMLAKYTDNNIVIIGDWNLTIGKLDKIRVQETNSNTSIAKNNTNTRAQIALSNLIERHELTDLWRYEHPEGTSHTWRSTMKKKSRKFTAARLDRIYVNNHIMNNNKLRTNSSIYNSNTGSDHKAIMTTFHQHDNNNNRTQWQMKRSILQDKNMREEIDEIIEEYGEKIETEDKKTQTRKTRETIMKRWDKMKKTIKHKIIEEMRKRKIEKILEEEQKERETSNLIKLLLHLQNNSDNYTHKMEKMEITMIDTLRKEHAKIINKLKHNFQSMKRRASQNNTLMNLISALLRKTYEKEKEDRKEEKNEREAEALHIAITAEKNPTFASTLTRKRKRREHIELYVEKTEDDERAGKEAQGKGKLETTSDRTTINKMIVDYYSELWGKVKSIRNIHRKKLTNALTRFIPSNSPAFQNLNTDITNDEIFEAMSTLKLKKTPGTDGLPAEFYLTYAQDSSSTIVKTLGIVFRNAIAREKMSNHQRKGKGILLHKKGDKKRLDNYRPLTMLNTDYKIFSLFIARRLKKVLPLIIGKEQQGFITNGNIKANIRVVKQLIEHHQNKNTTNNKANTNRNNQDNTHNYVNMNGNDNEKVNVNSNVNDNMNVMDTNNGRSSMNGDDGECNDKSNNNNNKKESTGGEDGDKKEGSTEEDPTYLEFLDFSKAFDRVDHTLLMQVMTKMNLGDYFVRLVKTLYADAYTTFNINGNQTEHIKYEAGVRQGCPASPYFYIIIIETLTALIRNDDSITGLNAAEDGEHIKVLAFADDTMLACKSRKDREKMEEHLTTFGRGSGAKLNREKCVTMVINRNNSGDDTDKSNNNSNNKTSSNKTKTNNSNDNSSISNSNNSNNVNENNNKKKNSANIVTYLGDQISTSLTSKDSLFSKIKNKAKSLLFQYRTNNTLNIYQRTHIANTIILPKFLYRATVNNITQNQIHDIQAFLYAFVLNISPQKLSSHKKMNSQKMKLHTATLPRREGGLGLLEFASMVEAERVRWIKPIITKQIIMRELSRRPGIHILHPPCYAHHINNINNNDKNSYDNNTHFTHEPYWIHPTITKMSTVNKHNNNNKQNSKAQASRFTGEFARNIAATSATLPELKAERNEIKDEWNSKEASKETVIIEEEGKRIWELTYTLNYRKARIKYSELDNKKLYNIITELKYGQARRRARKKHSFKRESRIERVKLTSAERQFWYNMRWHTTSAAQLANIKLGYLKKCPDEEIPYFMYTSRININYAAYHEFKKQMQMCRMCAALKETHTHLTSECPAWQEYTNICSQGLSIDLTAEDFLLNTNRLATLSNEEIIIITMIIREWYSERAGRMKSEKRKDEGVNCKTIAMRTFSKIKNRIALMTHIKMSGSRDMASNWESLKRKVTRAIEENRGPARPSSTYMNLNNNKNRDSGNNSMGKDSEKE